MPNIFAASFLHQRVFSRASAMASASASSFKPRTSAFNPSSLGAAGSSRGEVRWRAEDISINSRKLPSSSSRRSEEHTSELQSQFHLVCRLLHEKKKSRARRLHHHGSRELVDRQPPQRVRRHLLVQAQSEPSTASRRLLSDPGHDLFFFRGNADHRHLHSFPTRRSSD